MLKEWVSGVICKINQHKISMTTVKAIRLSVLPNFYINEYRTTGVSGYFPLEISPGIQVTIWKSI